MRTNLSDRQWLIPIACRCLRSNLPPYLWIDRNTEPHVLFAKLQRLFSGVPHWFVCVHRGSVTQGLKDAVGNGVQLRRAAK